MEAPDPKSPTWKVVPALIGVGLLVFMWLILDWRWFVGLSLLLSYEAWTLVNRYAHDTISEVVWQLVKRPLVPFLMGGGCVALVSHGIIRPTMEGLYTALAVGVLAGHFVFQRQND
jgi:hypothetical protein